MGRKSVAILDIRSSELTVTVGERGVNNTFLLKANRTEDHDGYDEEQFNDEKALSKTIFSAIAGVEQICGERVKELYVGVPGSFCTVIPREESIGFRKRRKIGAQEISQLYKNGKSEIEGYRFIRASSMIYITGDDRRVVNPLGLSSSKLSGVLSYFYCTEYFGKLFSDMFRGTKISLHFIPSEYATASYLIPSETRDEYALFLDSAFLHSTVCVLLGNGVCVQRTYSVGTANIVALIIERFQVEYDVATALLQKANLFAKKNAGKSEFFFRGKTYEIDGDALVETVREGLDLLCEQLGGFFEEYSDQALDYKPLYVSGDGIGEIRGALEHVGKRLNRVCELLAPDLPLYNRPELSSRIALLDIACEDHRKSGFWNRLVGGFGG